mmetsp:Transcript_13786/g.45345  ORF Transcript_13786/g.45345 Transcript_13786/m.45345 type:complete len:234 (+) Transcript_13786:2105-2806(+)
MGVLLPNLGGHPLRRHRQRRFIRSEDGRRRVEGLGQPRRRRRRVRARSGSGDGRRQRVGQGRDAVARAQTRRRRRRRRRSALPRRQLRSVRGVHTRRERSPERRNLVWQVDAAAVRRLPRLRAHQSIDAPYTIKYRLLCPVQTSRAKPIHFSFEFCSGHGSHFRIAPPITSSRSSSLKDASHTSLHAATHSSYANGERERSDPQKTRSAPKADTSASILGRIAANGNASRVWH